MPGSSRRSSARPASDGGSCSDERRYRARTDPGSGAAMSSLTIRNLTKTYFDPYRGLQVNAVRGVSLEVEQGDFICVVGPSGCGKSTILNMVAGFLPPSSGDILVGGRAVNGPGPDRGVVFQSFALFP